MERENIAMIIVIIVALIVDFLIFTNFQYHEEIVNDKKDYHEEEIVYDENLLHTEVFGNTYYKFVRYDYVLGQNMIVGVEKSVDGGKTYERVTSEQVIVSNESKFKFMNENQIFIISRKIITRDSNFKGFNVSNDGGKTFKNSNFLFINDKVDVINIMDFPYVESDKLKMKCFIHEPGFDGYEKVILTFISDDNGLNWHL